MRIRNQDGRSHKELELDTEITKKRPGSFWQSFGSSPPECPLPPWWPRGKLHNGAWCGHSWKLPGPSPQQYCRGCTCKPPSRSWRAQTLHRFSFATRSFCPSSHPQPDWKRPPVQSKQGPLVQAACQLRWLELLSATLPDMSTLAIKWAACSQIPRRHCLWHPWQQRSWPLLWQSPCPPGWPWVRAWPAYPSSSPSPWILGLFWHSGLSLQPLASYACHPRIHSGSPSSNSIQMMSHWTLQTPSHCCCPTQLRLGPFECLPGGEGKTWWQGPCKIC